MLLSGYQGEILENFGFFFKNFEKSEKKQAGTLSKTKKVIKMLFNSNKGPILKKRPGTLSITKKPQFCY